MTDCPICHALGQYRCNCRRSLSPKVRAHLKSYARIAGLKAGEKKRQRSYERFLALLNREGVLVAFQTVRRQGYRSGYEAARRAYGGAYQRPVRPVRIPRRVA